MSLILDVLTGSSDQSCILTQVTAHLDTGELTELIFKAEQRQHRKYPLLLRVEIKAFVCSHKVQSTDSQLNKKTKLVLNHTLNSLFPEERFKNKNWTNNTSENLMVNKSLIVRNRTKVGFAPAARCLLS